jgi:hypothetical protein
VVSHYDLEAVDHLIGRTLVPAVEPPNFGPPL